MTFLILGGTRFFGRTLAERLVAAGHDVAVLSRGHMSAPAGCEALVADRTDTAALTRALAGRRFDVVVDNVAFTAEDVAALLAILGDRLGQYVLTSSGSVYPDFTDHRLYHERDADLAELSRERPELHAYARGKREAELVLWRREGQIPPFTVVRPGFVVGPHDPTLRLHFFVQRVLDGHGVLLPNERPSLFQLVWHTDVARVIERVAGNPAAHHRAYHAVGQELFTYQSLVSELAAIAGAEAAFVEAPRERLVEHGLEDYALPYGGDGTVLAMDTGRMRDELDVEPLSSRHWMAELLSGVRTGRSPLGDSEGYARRDLERRLL